MNTSSTSSISSRLRGMSMRTIGRSLTIFLRKGSVSKTAVPRQTQQMTHAVSSPKTPHLTAGEKEEGRRALVAFMQTCPRAATSSSSGEVHR
ncbi:MAG TPA: hypothetical protein VHA78_00085 [Candidatus Peribacteraceae bacterium]|nr:hypothetical protein [Candidatus Peribacteraceae bacterium]